MKTPYVGPSALEINLQRTASEVRIPEEHKVLLEATKESVGVHEMTEQLLKEVNHPYVNWSHVLQDLRAYATGNFYYHNVYEKGDEAIAVLVRIFFSVADGAPSAHVRTDALRSLLRYLEKAVARADSHAARNRPAVENAFRGILERFEGEPETASLLSGGVRRVMRLAADNNPGWDEDLLSRVTRKALRETYQRWLSLPDPANWVEQADPTKIPSLDRIRHGRMREYLSRLDSAGDNSWKQLVSDTERLPDQTGMENLYLRAADEIESYFRGWEGYTKKVLFLLRILDTETLRQIRDPALRAINRALARALQMDERPKADRFIDAVFDSFGRGWLHHDTTVLDCIHTIASEVLLSKDDRLIQKVIDRILEHGFETPEIRGVNELWQHEVNPAHVKNIRSWLGLIALDPSRMKRLLAALIVHLKLGGVFISDTDLIQKDVVKLLNADIRPVFNLVKQLGKLFPIYFAEIGAEGQLRQVSTRVDELNRRQDSLLHFLRKQCHVESSNQLIPFVESIMEYWATEKPDALEPFLPAEIYRRVLSETEHLREMNPLFRHLAGQQEDFPRAFLSLREEEILELASQGDVSDVSREKTLLLVRLYQLLDAKYNVGPRGAVEAVDSSPLVSRESVEALRNALEDQRPLTALEQVVHVLEGLKETLLDPEPAESQEDIYHKRHIAAGIPSMYGRFINRKLDALGLTYRLESYGSVLFEELLEEENLQYLTKRGIARISRWLRSFQRALWVDGISGRGLGARIDMLDCAVAHGNLTIDQFVNIFQFMSRTLREMIRNAIVSAYEPDLERIFPKYYEGEVDGQGDREWVQMKFEGLLRDQMSSCFALQTLDNLISRILSTLAYEAETFSRSTRNLLMSYDVDKCYVSLYNEGETAHNPILFGHKGSFLRQMASFGYPVPMGFIVTTEVHRTYDALLSFRDLRNHSLSILKKHLRRVEERTGRSFGDPADPLLLSVRSGSAVSMPGILDTFLNVGINEEIAEGLSRKPRFGWAAWDSYRRFLQCWGLSYGVPQETFDEVFEQYKSRYSVEKKESFTESQIREVALACRQAIVDHGVGVVEEPFMQLRYSIERVIKSWDAERAKLYRKEMKIADDWGTAVVVQAMVYGNLDERSGTGVVLTRNPRKKTGGVSLYGDFVRRSQGEDVVRGVVETSPISEEQRQMGGLTAKGSLEVDFPEVYAEILRIAEDLVLKRGFNHQEIEFTFEESNPRSFYILQARDIITPEASMVTTFVQTPQLEKDYLTMGIAAGGGAISGRAAHNEEEILELWKSYPDSKIILVRPNTVPEDMHMIFLADGLLTSRGGSTSHAAVTAQRIGRTCVVGCRNMQVDEKAGRTTIGDKVIRRGDFISINGFDGTVYLGEHEVKQTRRLTDI